MPPRYAYWTILIDDKPTAFRAREREELLPTFNQLKRKNANIALKWFARGRLWESPEAERAIRSAPRPPGEKRTGDWRPGGAHKDPRDRFRKKHRDDAAAARTAGDQGFKPAPRTDSTPSGPAKPWANAQGQARPSSGRPPSYGARKPWSGKPPGQSRPWSDKPAGQGARKPWGAKPQGQARPWDSKPAGPKGDRRPWSNKPGGSAPLGGDRPWSGTRKAGSRPWSNKPSGPPLRGNTPSNAAQVSSPAGRGGQRPWSNKPKTAPLLSPDQNPTKPKPSESE